MCIAARKGTKKKDGADTKAEADTQANGIMATLS
jgi:hypothetical protein